MDDVPYLVYKLPLVGKKFEEIEDHSGNNWRRGEDMKDLHPSPSHSEYLAPSSLLRDSPKRHPLLLEHGEVPLHRLNSDVLHCPNVQVAYHLAITNAIERHPL